jgi:hypothetical protein
MVTLLDGREERVEIDMQDRPKAGACRHAVIVDPRSCQLD